MLKRARFITMLAVAFGFLLALTAGYVPAHAADANWTARYWNNRTLSGDPVLVREEANIDHDWGGGAPAPQVNDDNFSARWTRAVNFAAGTYRFTATMDDGMRVWVNDNLIIDSWYDSQVHSVSADVTLASGDHNIRVEYYEAGGVAVAQLTWTRLSGPAAPAPPTTVANWRGEYYNNVNLSGTAALVRDDPEINFIWGSSSPAPNVVNADRFSVRWTRTLNLNPGRYIFTVHVDDGARLWVNDQLIIDEWRVQSVTRYDAAIDLPGGATPVRMEYFENTGLAEARLSWSPPGTAPQPAPGGTVATMVGARYLNVRSGPGLEFDPFTYLTNGQTVEVIGRDRFAVWLQIRLPNGNTGWVSSRYMASNFPFTALPVTND